MQTVSETITGDGWAVGSIDGMGDGPGFRKVRRELDVKAFGVNAVVMPPGYASGPHYHDRQQEVYFLHAGSVEMEFGDGATQTLEAGAIARVDPSTVRRIRNVGDVDAVYVVVGGADGYVGRDGQVPSEDEERYRATQ